MEEYYRQRKAVQLLHGSNELDVFNEQRSSHCSYNIVGKRR